MNIEIQNKLIKDEKYIMYLRENSNYYKLLNRSRNNYDKFIKEIKDKYKLNTIDKIDTIVDSVDLISKIIDI